MTLTERAQMIESLTKSLTETVAKYEKAKENCPHTKPWVGRYNNGVYIGTYESAQSLRNRIKLIRAKLMRLSNELG